MNNQDRVINTIAGIKAMLAEVPDRVIVKLTCEGDCKYKVSKHFANTLECVGCSDLVELSIYERIKHGNAD